MRQVSWIGTTLLVGAAVAMWVPFPTPDFMRSISASATITVDPTMFILFLVNELVLQNPSLKVITSGLLIWAGLGLMFKTATSSK